MGGEDSRVAALEARLAAALKAGGVGGGTSVVDGGGGGASDPYADRKDSQGRCKFCMRKECLYIEGGRPCREYNQALNFLNEQRAQRRKAAAEEKAKMEE